MANYVVGAVLLAAMFLALRHIYRNFISGQCDCLSDGGSGCGCSGKDCTCCHTEK
ncbi:MAG: FeoB-associated Cys-rich membrane protein [Selenomonadaceae bacterium]|nr:FeoB-associated Cys-rich membrane protein [Selenomonadaceae bacterium]